MIIRFFGPFNKIVQEEIQITLKEPIKLKDLLGYLSSTYPDFHNYINKRADGNLSNLLEHIAFIRNGELLKLNNTIEDNDTLNGVLAIYGG